MSLQSSSNTSYFHLLSSPKLSSPPLRSLSIISSNRLLCSSLLESTELELDVGAPPPAPAAVLDVEPVLGMEPRADDSRIVSHDEGVAVPCAALSSSQRVEPSLELGGAA